jgi:hypothetical protein
MPTALRAAGAMVALLVFSFQDVAAGGKNTCDTEHDIDAKAQSEQKLLQANTSPKLVAAEVEKIVQCQCETVKNNGKCSNKGGLAFAVRKCGEITSSNDCEEFKKKKHGKHKGKHPCKWIRTPSPTPSPTPVPPTPSPTPEPTSCWSTLPATPTYREIEDAKCKAAGDATTSDRGTWRMGIATGSAQVDPDCRKVCDMFPWCRAYTQLYQKRYFNGKLPNHFALYTCDMLVDEKIWAADPVVAAEKEKWPWNVDGKSYPSDNSGYSDISGSSKKIRKFPFPKPCEPMPEDLNLRGKELTLSIRCSTNCHQVYDDNVYGDGSYFEYKGYDSIKMEPFPTGAIVKASCFQKE